ncbi:hypothetical protein OIU76_021759 [Salix suchowensis]|nr:hypothetical protein OIU76_021759 [Salix suchowensis]
MLIAGKLVVAEELFSRLFVDGIQPTLQTYSVMIKGLLKEGLSDEAYKLFRKMEDDGFLPDSCSYNVIIQGFLQNRDSSTAVQFIDEMPISAGKLSRLQQATDKKVVKADAYVVACDVPGIKRLLPSQWRESKFFDNIYELVGVPVVTVQLRYNGWVTELQDLERSRQLRQASGLDNLLYTPDADFSCFADLALTSPEDYYIEGQGSLLQ